MALDNKLVMLVDLAPPPKIFRIGLSTCGGCWLATGSQSGSQRTRSQVNISEQLRTNAPGIATLSGHRRTLANSSNPHDAQGVWGSSPSWPTLVMSQDIGTSRTLGSGGSLVFEAWLPMFGLRASLTMSSPVVLVTTRMLWCSERCCAISVSSSSPRFRRCSARGLSVAFGRAKVAPSRSSLKANSSSPSKSKRVPLVRAGRRRLNRER